MKPLEDFYRPAGMKDGYRHDCKACNLDEKRRRYLADPATAKARVKRWQQQNPDRLNALTVEVGASNRRSSGGNAPAT